jgi:glutamyl-tRNA reductase
MAIITLGLNHNTAPISVRERLAFPTEHVIHALRKLNQLPCVEEAAILSTCNRTEFYCGFNGPNRDPLIDWIAEQQQLTREEFQPFLYTHADSSTIRHMFRVASGLDSMVLG